MMIAPLLLALVVATAGEDARPVAVAADTASAAGAPATATTAMTTTAATTADGPAVATPDAASAETTDTTASSSLADPRLTLRFADHLFADGDYYRAISEYRRFLFLTRGSGGDAPRAAMAIGEALLRGEQWDAAGRQFDGVATRTDDLVLRRGALFGAARAYLEDGRPELAKPRFRLLAQDDGADAALRAHSRWLLAWGHFDAGELEKARELFDAIARGDDPRAASARGVVDAIDRKGELPLRDPLVAALLSVVPGGGHFYLGQWATGVTSLGWNALFIFAAVSAWLAGDWGVATVLTFAELGWYSGSMFGAIAGAYRHNRDAVRNWRDDVLAAHGAARALPELHTVADEPPGSLLRLRGSF
jgi:tetratricopeptide (TPR) repeat protein